jgi:trypsin
MFQKIILLILIEIVLCKDFQSSFDSDPIEVPDFAPFNGEKQPKIVGGEDAYIEDVPYQVSLRILNETTGIASHTCGGFIITSDAIVTAAHCIFNRLHRKFLIRAGSDLRSQGGQVIDVTKIIYHEDYQASGFYNDIAILRLAKKLKFNRKVWPIGLPPKGFRISDGTPLLVSGWGTLTWSGSSPERLQKVYVPAVSNEDCSKVYSNIREHKICAGIVGKDSCQGFVNLFCK